MKNIFFATLISFYAAGYPVLGISQISGIRPNIIRPNPILKNMQEQSIHAVYRNPQPQRNSIEFLTAAES